MNITDRIKYIVPSGRVTEARAIAGINSFTTELLTPPGIVTHYISAAHPSAISSDQHTQLTTLPGLQVYDETISTKGCLQAAGLAMREDDLTVDSDPKDVEDLGEGNGFAG